VITPRGVCTCANEAEVADPMVPVVVRAATAAPGVGGTVRRVYIASGLALVGNQAFTLLLFIVLPVAQVGLVNWGTAVCALVFYVLDGGIETAVVIAAKRQPVPLRTMVVVLSTFRGAATVIALAAWGLGVLSGRLGQAESLVLLLVGASNMVRLLQSPYTAALQVGDRQADAAFINTIPMVIRLAGLGVLALVHHISINAILVSSLVGDGAGLAIMAAVASAHSSPGHGALSARELARGLLGAAPMIMASQAVVIAQSRIDWLLVAALASYAALANYALANKAVEVIVLAGSIFGRAALPWFVEGWASRDIGPTVRYLIAITTAGGLVLAEIGWPVLHVVTGDKYAGAAPMIPILAALGPALVIFQVVQYAVVGQGAARSVVIAGGGALLAQVATDLYAIPRYGGLGATFGMCAFALVSLPLLLALARRDAILRGRPALELLVGGALLPAGLIVILTLQHVL
jgi:O-antigen/teichoic acid export membrane protein